MVAMETFASPAGGNVRRKSTRRGPQCEIKMIAWRKPWCNVII